MNAMPVQRSQLLSLPLSGLLMGPLTALLYARTLGWLGALSAGALLGVLLCATAAWLAYRSDCGARHTVAGSLLFMLFLAPLLGGAYLALAHLAGLAGWLVPAWLAGSFTVLLSVLGPAWQTRTRLAAQGEAGPWARTHVDLQQGLLLPGGPAGADAGGARPSPAPWIVGALAVNLPLAWRMLGGGDAGLMFIGLAFLACGVVWGGVAQLGPALGQAWFVLDIEGRTGRRLQHPQLAEVQAMRRAHWLARWFVREV